MHVIISFLVLGTYFLCCYTQDSFTPNGYVFTSARTLKKKNNNELHLRRFGNLESGFINISLLYKANYSAEEYPHVIKQFPIPEGERYSTLNFPLDDFESASNEGKLKINGEFGSYAFNGIDEVKFDKPDDSIVIIQTDKPLYQPGQTVKFRILRLDKDFKPTYKNNIANAFVVDPKQTRLFQFNDINLQKGIVQFEFTLSEEPVLGYWRIEVKIADSSYSTEFHVSEYELPTYDLKINFPSYTLSTAENIPVEICAKYTYGKPVQGLLNVTVYSMHNYYYNSRYSKKPRPEINISEHISGCYNFNISVPDIEPDGKYYYSDINVYATFGEDGEIDEDGSGTFKEDTKYLSRTTHPLELEFFDGLEYYKPGLPYNGKLKVSNPDKTPAPNEPIEICTIIDKQRILAVWFAKRKIEICSNFTSNARGIIAYTILPQNVDDVSISLEAKSLKYHDSSSENRNLSLEQPRTSKFLDPFYSPSGSFIQIQPVHDPLPCGVKQTFKLLFTADGNSEFKFYYQVIHEETIVVHNTTTKTFSMEKDVSSKYEMASKIIDGMEMQLDPPSSVVGHSAINDFPSVRYLPYIGEVDIDVEIDQNLSPQFFILVYYVKDNREIVADSIQVQVDKCFKNKVNFSFADKQKQPGLSTEIKISASPNSLCGIRAVDKSLLLLDSNDQLTKDKVFDLRNDLFNTYYFASSPCSDKRQPGLSNDAFTNITRPPAGVYGSSNYVDSIAAFQNPKLLVISDLFIATRPCKKNNGYDFSVFDEFDDAEYITAEYATGEYLTGEFASYEYDSGEAATQSVSDVRTDFPETWLFELEMTGSDGIFKAKEKLPDSITQWIGRAVCLNTEDGLGISDDTNITAFQAFFIDYTLPLSAIRGEEFDVIVSLSNYVDGALPVTVTLDHPTGFTVVNGSINENMCIQPKGKTSIHLTLKGTQVGKVNITVRAETTSKSSVCGNSTVSKAYARDAIRKPLEIEAEGFSEEKVINSLICPADSSSNVYKTSVILKTPSDLIPDSARAYIDFDGNILGPAINNLDNLVSLPTGCGEQNMVKFTPNYLVLDYLKHIGKLTEDIKTKVIRNLNTGYQRELTYRHGDGSFSAFGTSDEEGSMFLTAFVLRSFYEAKKYIYIDDDVLKQMEDWIVSKQRNDGCFPNYGEIVHIDIEGGLKEKKSNGSITAYVLTSLVISNSTNSTAINKAFNCLQQNPPTNPYSQLLYAYAEALMDKKKVAENHINEARQRISRNEGVDSFIIVNGTKNIVIEADAYAVLSTLAVGKKSSEVVAYVRYLTNNFNPYGGFSSTQDTCVGLHALSQFAKLVYKDPLDLQIQTSGGLKQMIKINDKNKLLVQRYKVSDISKGINITAKGSGCGLIQTTLRYNTKLPPEEKKFSIQVNGDCLDSNCKKASINVFVSYIPTGLKSGMSIVEIKLITGFVPVKESINKVKLSNDNKVLRVDVENNKVILYLDEVSNKVQVINFQVEQLVKVTNAKPGTAKVYDYYANENSSSTSYTINGTSTDVNSS
ncbi:alpha-2-macroglobulin isoform X2 [Parasteatoda tepidariorum]|nr:alpha-2-macroglobulin [Parasteatoda tepidariorum]